MPHTIQRSKPSLWTRRNPSDADVPTQRDGRKLNDFTKSSTNSST
ncbi:hypothetical protein F441_21495 [Phytophthora nicotianae CJ01A1]|uniref:Uncharacterized protein n=2 Tax=Phytophthora nicotianae TaxID=4792 RepID=V9DZI2_PHYNI|nr:hypothetical protein F443_21621 [Phytophthora nicotianae P1569]ETP01235.1 hypothetical protein F441_21495 [Phytophthora nicotianae CJ01A1]